MAGEADDAATGGGRVLLRQWVAMVRLSLIRYARSRHLITAVALFGFPIPFVLLVTGLWLAASTDRFNDPLQLQLRGIRFGETRVEYEGNTRVVTRRTPGLGTTVERYEGNKLVSDVQTPDVREARSTVSMTQILLRKTLLGFSIIFAAVLFGNSALREEVDEQTLHYLYLQPLPRWVMVAGKLFGYVAMAGVVMVACMVVIQFLFVLPFGWEGAKSVLWREGRLGYLLLEVVVALLALVCYCALFLALSTIFKTHLYALIIFGWEAASGVLPAVLKNFTLSWYLKNLLPDKEAVSAGPLAILAEPPSTLESLVILSIVVGICLGFACWQTHRRECIYSEA